MSGARDELDTVYSVTVRRENGDERLLSLCRTEEEFRDFTVLELKSRVAQAFNGVADLYHGSDPIRSICLEFADKRLKDKHTLSFYGIKHHDTIHVTLAVEESAWNDDSACLYEGCWDYKLPETHAEGADRAWNDDLLCLFEECWDSELPEVTHAEGAESAWNNKDKGKRRSMEIRLDL